MYKGVRIEGEGGLGLWSVASKHCPGYHHLCPSAVAMNWGLPAPSIPGGRYYFTEEGWRWWRYKVGGMRRWLKARGVETRMVRGEFEEVVYQDAHQFVVGAPQTIHIPKVGGTKR